jgi:hypothetical protein
MTITNGYLTLSELQRAIGRTVDASDVRKDWLEECIERGSRMFDSLAGDAFFYEKNVTGEYIDAYGVSGSGFWINESLKSIHCSSSIISVSSIVEDSETLVENTDFYRYKTYIDRDGLWSTSRRAIVMSCKIGYTATPKDVTQATTQIAMALSGLAIASYTDDVGSQIEVIKNNIPKWVFDTANRYRKVQF